MSDEIKIYVADLAAYNAGHLHGVWIDATLEVADIKAQIQRMLSLSPVQGAEEYAIHDHEGFGRGIISEYEGLDYVHDVACFIAEHEELGIELLNYFCDLEEARIAAEENYQGCHASLADYAQTLTEDTTEIPKSLEFYIDYERMAQDMEMSGDIYSIQTAHEEVHVFWSR